MTVKYYFLYTILGFISDWLVFYHLGHEVAEDAKEYLSDLQLKVQKVGIIHIYEIQWNAVYTGKFYSCYSKMTIQYESDMMCRGEGMNEKFIRS